MKHIETVGSHSHEEVWNLVPGLTPDLQKLAEDLLPAMKRYKQLIIGIGAAALKDSVSGEIASLARELARISGQTARDVAVRYEDAAHDVLVGQIVRETQLMGSQASVIALLGVNADSARALRVAYRNLRNSCTALWQFEFAPEGNPLTSVAGGKS